MEKEGVWMALPIAVVEDQISDAQRLEELLQQQLPEAEAESGNVLFSFFKRTQLSPAS